MLNNLNSKLILLFKQKMLSHIVFAFKMAYTGHVEMYPIRLDDTMEVFINNVKNKAYLDFNVNPENEEIEVVVAGQIQGEEAPALQGDRFAIFRDYFQGQHPYMAFYIRKRLLNQENLLDEEEENLCVICMENAPHVMFQTCRHVCTCHSCYNNLRGSSDVCPLCRTYIDGFIQV